MSKNQNHFKERIARANTHLRHFEHLLDQHPYPDSEKRWKEIGQVKASMRKLIESHLKVDRLTKLLKSREKTEAELRKFDAEIGDMEGQLWKLIQRASDGDLRGLFFDRIRQIRGLDSASKKDLREHYHHLELQRLRRELAKGGGLLDMVEVGVLAKTREKAVIKSKEPPNELEFERERAISAGRSSFTGGQVGGYLKAGVRKIPPSELQTALDEKMAANPSLKITRAREFVANDLGVSLSTMKNHTCRPTSVELKQARGRPQGK